MKELTEFMYASQFSEATVYPLKTLKKMIKKGILPYQKSGRRYLLNTKKTISILNDNFDNNMTVDESKQAIARNHEEKIKKEEFHARGFLLGLNSILN